MRAIDDMISQKVVNQKGCWAEYTILDIYKLYNIYSEFFAIYIYIHQRDNKVKLGYCFRNQDQTYDHHAIWCFVCI